MDFHKMHGLGNDFVVVAADRLPADPRALAQAVCDRHFGVGADGLVFVLPSGRADVAMRIFNADGSEAEQCGNAVRCVGKFAFEQGLARGTELTVETRAGVQRIWLDVAEGRVSAVKVDMGPPVLEGPRIPIAVDRAPVVDHPVAVEGRTFAVTAVSMGNPHAVIFVDDAPAFPVNKWGPKLEAHPLFPQRTNVEFVSVRRPDEVDMRVWERGVGPTLACGTGACATVVAGVLTGRTARAVRVHLAGGTLDIEWDERTGHVFMTGPAQTVFTGTWMGESGMDAIRR